MTKNFKNNPRLHRLFLALDQLQIPFTATILENSVFTVIDDVGKELKVACLVDNFETLND